MKVLCILLCVAFASGFYIDNNGTHEEKIIGGEPVEIEDLPYQASLFWYVTDNMCGATIIHASWVITAAHCVKNKSHISVRTGTGLRKTSGRIHTVEKIIIHDDFKTNSKDNDIALIMLEVPIQFNDKQQSIELAKPYDIPREHEFVRISGFGHVGPHGRTSLVLMAAYVPVVNQKYCKTVYRLEEPITDNMFCVGSEEAEICFGDSGGPAVIHGKLYGIISSGNCGFGRFPAVLTRVHKYYNWIREKTGLIL